MLCVLIFIHKWRDLQFKVDSERQIFFFEKLFMAILFILSVLARNLLRENRQRNIFIFCSDVGPEAQTLAFRLISQNTTY